MDSALNGKDCNKEAWGKIAEEHYYHYKSFLERGEHKFNPYIKKELGDIRDKDIIHLQCNTGADTILLSQMGAKKIVGVDFVPKNIFYAQKLASDLHIDNTEFIVSDIAYLKDVHNKKYDIVFTSEGVIGWNNDLRAWASSIRHLLKDDGYLYVFDSHPFFLSFDETKLSKEIYEIKYPYFGKEPDISDSIGGYACDRKYGVKAYYWMYTVSNIINCLTSEGLHIEYFNEFSENFFDSGDMKELEGKGLYYYDYNKDKYPMSFSLKATVYKK